MATGTTAGVGVPISRPEQPRFASASERKVRELLRQQLGPHDLLVANLRVTDERKDHDADLVVVRPGAGVCVSTG